MRSSTLATLFCLAWLASAAGQTAAPAFEVASVKKNAGGDSRWYGGLDQRGRLSVTNMPLRDVIAQAYGISDFIKRFSIVGGPDDILSARFDIKAKPEAEVSRAQGALMLRALLAERFKLRIHAEKRQLPIYALIRARDGKLGPDLRRSTSNCAAFMAARAQGRDPEEPRDAYGARLCTQSYDFGPTMKMRYAGPIDDLVNRVQGFVDRPVVDATGLTGNFDWVIPFAINPLDSDLPSIYDVVQDRLGLKLDRRVGPFEVFVIESVQMPTPD